MLRDKLVIPPRIFVVLAGMLFMFSATGWGSTASCTTSGSGSGCPAVDQNFSTLPVITPANNDFASTGVGTNYLYNPTVADQGGSGWTFSSLGGDASGKGDGALIYGSQWYTGTPPGGPEVAGLQQFSGSTQEAYISQSVSGFTVGSNYDVNFYMAQRVNQTLGTAAGDTIEVILGGQVLGTYTPKSATWTPVTTSIMTATATTMNLEFLSTSIGVLSTSEVDTLFDGVTITDPLSTPEPGTAWMVGGMLLLLPLLRKLVGKGGQA